MNREQQIESYDEIQEYLQKNNVYGTFSQLVQQLMLEKPSNPLDFILQELQKPEKVTLFVVGPPGLAINTIIRKAISSANKNYEVFNFGQELNAIQKLLDDKEKDKLKSCKLVNSDSVKSIIDNIEKYAKSQKNYIIEGFPKNLSQALILQQRGIYAKNVLIININFQGLKELCTKKIQQLNPSLQPTTKAKLVQEAMFQHHLYINQVKRFYKRYMEIDLSGNRDEQYIIQELDKAFSIKTVQAVPRLTTQILLLGAPFSGRTTLGKKIAEHYGLVYISTSFLIAEEIRRDSIHGRKVKTHYLNNQLIDNFLVEKLIEDRIAKKDCRMQGFVLEGYPKTKEQLDNIRNMKLDLTMIVGIDTPKALSQQRSNIPQEKFDARFEKWKVMADHIKETKETVFWVDPTLNIGNAYEEVVHELEKQFI